MIVLEREKVKGDSIPKAHTILNNFTKLFMDKEKISEALFWAGKSKFHGLTEWKQIEPQGSLKDGAVVRVLSSIGVPMSYFTDSRAGKISFKIDNLEKACEGLDDPVMRAVVNSVLQVKRAEAVEKNLKQYLDLPSVRSLSFEGHEMCLAKPVYNWTNTYRLQASNPSIQNVMREMQGIYTVPEGYVPMFSDSSQVEPSIIYNHYMKVPELVDLIKMYGDIYYAVYHYCVYGENDKEKKEISSDLRNHIKLLSNKYMYGGYLPKNPDDLSSRYFQRITNNPARLEWQERVEAQVRRRDYRFYNYFGMCIDVSANEKEEDMRKVDSSDERTRESMVAHLTRCGINNVVQATASSLMCESVAKAGPFIINNGFGYISYYKHDEGMFGIKEEKAYLSEKIIPGFLSYQVDDWALIKSDLKVGCKPMKYV